MNDCAVELRRAAAFSDLQDDQIEWFLSEAEGVHLHAGETFVKQGDPADWMFIFLEALFQLRGEFGGEIVSLPSSAGEVSGGFPFFPDETVQCHRASVDGWTPHQLSGRPIFRTH